MVLFRMRTRSSRGEIWGRRLTEGWRRRLRSPGSGPICPSVSLFCLQRLKRTVLSCSRGRRDKERGWNLRDAESIKRGKQVVDAESSTAAAAAAARATGFPCVICPTEWFRVPVPSGLLAVARLSQLDKKKHGDAGAISPGAAVQISFCRASVCMFALGFI